MVEKIVFTKSTFDNLAIEKEFGIVLWIIGILRVLAEIEFKFSNIQYWDTINEQLISINLESNSIEIVQCQIKKKSYEIYFLPIFSTKLPINTT